MKRCYLFTTAMLHCIAIAAENIDINTNDSTKVKDIEEVVIVSAPKETAKLRNMPTSVSIFDSENMDDNQIKSLKELSAYVPNFYMPDYGSSLTSAAYIRGIGSRINTPAVGLYVDNVAYTDKSAYDINLLEVERIDILRGPQATLYGRNAMGGLMRVFTRNPFRYQGTDINLQTSIQDKGYQISASHYGKINNNTAYSISGFYKDRGGFYENVFRNERTGNVQSGGGRGRFLWMPTENLKLDFSADYSYNNENGYPYQYRGAVNPDEEEMKENIGTIFYNSPSFYERNLFNTSLNLQYTADRYIMSSVTAYQFLKDNMTLDQDFTNKDYFSMSQKQRINSWSEELTFKSRTNTTWEWVNGIYMMYQDLNTKSPVAMSNDFMNAAAFKEANAGMAQAGMGISMKIKNEPFRTDGSFETPTTDLAYFHQSTFNNIFNIDGLSFTAGIRFEYEKMNLKYNYGGEMNYDVTITSPMMPLELKDLNDATTYNGKIEHDYLQWLPKVALQYHFDRKNNIYASWSKGYRSGGYNIQMFSDLVQGSMRSLMATSVKNKIEEVFAQPPFNQMPPQIQQMIISKIPQFEYNGTPQQTKYKPEYSYNYEVGGHFSAFDDKLQIDAAAFFMDVYDQQISKFVNSGLGRMMVNAGRGQSYGAEIALKGGLLENNLTWNASYGYTHSTFKRYVAQESSADNEKGEIYNGNYVPFAPAHTVAAGIEYYHPIRSSIIKGMFAGVNTTGAGKIYWTEDNKYSQPFYALLNAHVGADFGKVKVNIWGKNITDTRYDTFFFTSEATTTSLQYGQCGNPIQVGININIHL